MLTINHIPLVRILVPFLAGIITVLAFDKGISTKQFLLSIAVIFVFLALLNKILTDNYGKRWVYGFFFFLFFFLAGNTLTVNNNDLKKTGHFSNYIDKKGHVKLIIIEPVSERENSFRIVGRVKKVITDSIVYKVRGKVMLYVEKDSLASTLEYGDIIITNNHFREVNPPQNPYQFNYKRHLAYNNIYYQGYRPTGNYIVIKSDGGNFLLSYALSLRNKAMDKLKNYHVHDREFAVLSALLLGYREYVDDELYQQFSGAGAMHILCVSGLHVGIIYLIINSILFFLNKFKNGKIYKSIIIILLIWFYATLTGFSPSVLRASTMFSFVAVARSFNRYTNIYNVLAASAFLLIIIDPYIITKIGFQLSYLAVISIVTLQPHLYKLLFIKNLILDKAWSIVTVSIAAQIAVAPLVIYYFNLFSNYFILTNLAVIPLAYVIIYSSLIFLVVSSIGFLAGLLGKIISFFVFCMHKSVQFIESLPYSNIQNVYINIEETFILLFIIIAFAGFLILKSKFFLKIALISVLIILASFSVKNIKQQRQNIFIVYSINNNTAVDFISGRESSSVISGDLLMQRSRDIDYNIVPNRIKNGIDEVNNIVIGNDTTFLKPYLFKTGDYYLFNDLKIKILTDSDHFDKQDNLLPIEVDYLVLTKNPWLEIIDLKKKYDFKKLIIDSSNSFWRANRWVEECKKLGIDYWSTRHQGAYVNYRR